MKLGELVKKYRSEHDLSQRQFAAKCGVSNGYISMLEDGKNPKTGEDIFPSLQSYKKIASAMGMSVHELLSLVDDHKVNLDFGLSPVRTRKIPLLGEIACGKPIFASEDRESYVSVGTDMQVDFCLRAKGDSMINARILDGDIVFIQKCDVVHNGEIAAVIIDDEATLKRVYYYPERSKLVLNPENPSYEPLVYVGEELNQIHILGRAVAFQSDVR